MKDLNIVNDLNLLNTKKLANYSCATCDISKFTRLPFPKISLHTSTAPLHKIHSDIWGPISTSTLSGCHILLFL